MVDVSVIGRGVDSVVNAEVSPDVEEAYRQVGELAEQLAAKNAELDRLRDQKTVEQVKANILEEYVNKIFVFVSFYCGVVGLFIFLAALPGDSFSLPESILAIIAGSTAVSVIGLIGLVITGLFGGKAQG